jgi:membrane associated rhomboid family serine protease
MNVLLARLLFILGSMFIGYQTVSGSNGLIGLVVGGVAAATDISPNRQRRRRRKRQQLE